MNRGATELTPLSAVLPCPANRGWIRELPVQVTVPSYISFARTVCLQVIVDVGSKVWITRPPLHCLGNLLLVVVLRAAGVCGICALDPIAKLPQACIAAFHAVGLPGCENGR
jgi:hypothetical protein